LLEIDGKVYLFDRLFLYQNGYAAINSNDRRRGGAEPFTLKLSNMNSQFFSLQDPLTRDLMAREQAMVSLVVRRITTLHHIAQGTVRLTAAVYRARELSQSKQLKRHLCRQIGMRTVF
jgi:hypothetical protein